VDGELDREGVVAEVRAAFEQYERDLVANDVDALVAWFWDDPRAVRYGIDEMHVGHDAIAEYRRSQAQATPPRQLRNTRITTFGDDVAIADTEFVPDGADGAGVVGRQSQTWVRFPVGWRIVSAHVSWLSGRRP
jgi:hypothetical protein